MCHDHDGPLVQRTTHWSMHYSTVAIARSCPLRRPTTFPSIGVALAVATSLSQSLFPVVPNYTCTTSPHGQAILASVPVFARVLGVCPTFFLAKSRQMHALPSVVVALVKARHSPPPPPPTLCKGTSSPLDNIDYRASGGRTHVVEIPLGTHVPEPNSVPE
ncbi:hypothetical protein B0H10DRAFT_1956374 [Mycena sp. CBHHK59/15]|nr:hypothetical protein B0H10DRAFT_1956374 [Mycena sp. CBHHK59/15]